MSGGANDNEKRGGSNAMGRACPICGKPTVEAYRPFCSKRCADVDLNRWLTGAYAIPVVADEDEDGEQPDTPRS
ncbi:DNA gyrase inhibitor YacG [Aquabacter sediminis]|uniref:DNA gyrase inhibitor YacG n=1 Tax=Aquabacter sediminis TaxID=3029197 RepID=UPI00237D81F9|nr:DNA gyrase inhibitor YacG [Aquabacter sp. P-9]MDE1567844.1 DNA gyrase inhibitor YacG [Aquabacter sp. P-9]